mgnify:FL=1
MLRANFDLALQQLRDQIMSLGSQVGDNIVKVVEALFSRDFISAERLIAGDRQINQQRIRIMNDALTLIATQQPVAGDMRLIASSLEITGELERINDYVKGIARISLMIGPDPIPAALDRLTEMAEMTRYMLQRALDAAAQEDTELARAIPAEDDQVDELFNQIYRNLVTYITENPSQIEQVNRLEWAAHNLERAADRVINICEWVVYATTAEYIEMDTEVESPPQQR